jgi:ATP-dependent RNA helicase DDX58
MFLSKVVGLTASVGVGKAKSIDQAVDHILHLCANLHCDEICTVRKNLAELGRNVNKPDEGYS